MYAFLGTLPASMTVSDVVTFTVTSETLPASVIARRSTLDELVYDSEIGFTDAWRGHSTLSETEDGFVLVLGRRAFSAAGSAVYWLDGAESGGGVLAGNVTGPSDENEVVALGDFELNFESAADGKVLGFDGGQIVAVDGGSAGPLEGDVTGDSDDNEVSQLQGVTLDLTGAVDGQVIGLSGGEWVPVDSGGGGDAIVPAVYQGHSVTAVGAFTTTWADVVSQTTMIDDVQSGVTRTSSDFQVDATGYYQVHAETKGVIVNVNGSADPVHALRLRDVTNGTTLLLASQNPLGYTSGTGVVANQIELSGVAMLTAGINYRIQQCSKVNSPGGYGPTTLDGATEWTLGISFVGVPDSSVLVAGDSDNVSNASTVDGATVTDALDALDANSKAEVFRGYNDSGNTAHTADAWLGIISALGSWVDVIQDGITRSGSTFTCTKGGYYLITGQVNFFATVSQYAAMRVVVSGSTVHRQVKYNGNTAPGTDISSPLNAIILLTPGQTFTLEYFVSVGATADYGAGALTLGGETLNTTHICVARLGA